MKTKCRGILTLLLAFVVQLTFAQEKTISGTVSDDSGLPLPGATVLVKGTSTGTSTDFDGKYSIKASQGSTLTFSFVGYSTKEVIVGASNTINVTMTEDAESLEEVVVTALGIKREKKSLGYSTQQVGGEQISTAKESNFVNSLSGKIAGLDIKKSNTLGGSTNVILRGITSLSGNNQVLFVIDGIPISNANNNTGSQIGGGGGYDYGNAASDVNPDDIESVNVLKGAAATALYGSRASNGVIVIVTKKGKTSDKLGVTISSSIITSNYDKNTFPVFQKEYGAGYGPYYGPGDGNFFIDDFNGDGIDDSIVPSTEDASFGGRFDGRLVYQWDSFFPQLDSYNQARPWLAPKNGPETFFKQGITTSNNISINKGFENGSFRLSYTRLESDGILPNSNIGRHTVDFNGSANLSDKLTATAKVTFIDSDGLGRYGTGYDAENLMTNFRQWWQTNVDIKDQRNAYFATKQNITWNPHGPNDLSPIYWDNPYWTRYENYNNDNRKRVIGNLNLTYKFTNWLDVMGRITLDTFNEKQEERNNIGSVDLARYTRRNISQSEYNYDLFLNFNTDIVEKVGLKGLVGINTNIRKWDNISAGTNGGLVLPGQYRLDNTATPLNPPFEYVATQKVFGTFANASIDYDNTLFVEGSIRRDITSTLPKGDNTSDYYAVSGSLLFSELFDSNWLDFGKLRVGYSEVGSGQGPYQTKNTFNSITTFNGTALYSNPASSANPNLKEERTESLEAGIEMTFFKKRLGLDLSVYKTETRDLITNVETPSTTGFTGAFVNAGLLENKGIEASIFGTPIKTDNFSWNVNLNWAKNENELKSLYGDSENILLASFFGVTVNATVGEPYGTIKGTDYVYLDGQPVVGANGKYEKTESRQEVLGNYNPDWKAGINNSFRYKNLAFSFLIDIQEGGSVFSGDTYFGYSTGLYEDTAGLNDLGNPLRDPVTTGSDSGGVILPGVQADGSANTVRAAFDTYANPYGRYGNAPDAKFVYDASYIKLREVTLSYSLPEKYTKKLPFSNITLTATGRNLWIIDKDLPYADPEAGFSSGNVQGVQIGAYPSTKDYSLNLKLEF